jgi:tetratricopeptide (TPR) repeat protein
VKFHPNDLAMEEFYLSQSEEHQELLKHLAKCARCYKLLQRVVGRPQGESSSFVYEEALQRVECAVAAREGAVIKERAGAPALFVEMMKLSLDQQRLLIRNSPRFQTWGLLELLLERAFEGAVQNPSEAEELSLLALDLSERLNPGYYGAGVNQDMQARAWAYLANARRLKSDFRGAADAFSRAEVCLKKGSSDPIEHALHLDLKASLLRAQRRFREALQLLEQAVGLFCRHGQPHRAGRSLVKMSTVYHYAGDIPGAIPLLFKALCFIDPEVEPRLLLCARHNLSDYLASSGRFLEARKVYRETLSLYREFPDAGTQSRRKWVKGKIAFGLGQLGQSESLFLAAREGFITDGASYDVALVSLELASVYARQGRTADLKRIAEEMLPIFSSLEIQREALAALAFLRQALDAERASVEVVSKVAEFFRRAQFDPALRFEAPPINAEP